MCNAYGHPLGCDCGFGGDTGGGGGVGVTSVRAVWNSNEPFSTFESYVNPNARCPVCGAEVFFYQSPYGGRVYFDDLGPPWPKHPCTDNSRTRFTIPNMVKGLKRSEAPRWLEEGWSPLKIHRFLEGCAIVSCQKAVQSFDIFFSIKAPIVVGSLCFYRPADWPGILEIAYFTGEGSRPDGVVLAARGQRRPGNSENIEAAIKGEAIAQNALGWALSFGCGDKNVPDWASAKYWFDLSARQGFWVAENNLGVLYLKGHGVKKDDHKAFEHFRKAAQSLNPIPLRHLADMYEKGLGVQKDLEQARFHRELAKTSEKTG